ncbi:MAG TPA: NrtA/SsuA/CpmA family ABC transporter substrate-binding protein [Polyangiaceae bacterium]|nr:NrtA/SsuA/CpmA family ABC transporter substrate-binding protein [Polyangiaceae bacterium]
MIDALTVPRWLGALVLSGFALGGAAGCSRSESGAPPPSPPPTAADPAPTGTDNHVVIKFSDPGNAGALAYAKREGILERELAKADAEIEWVPGAGSFSASFEAMNSGAINASGAAVSPIIGALSHNLKFKIFSIGDPGGTRRAGILARDEKITRPADLVGKRVAVNWAAHGDYILLRALEKYGVPADQVTRVPIQPPDAAAAFATGKIDAWSTFGVFYSTALANGAHVVASEDELGSDDVTVTSANVAVLEKNPAAFLVFVRVVQELTRESRQHPEKFQNVFVSKGPTATSGARLQADIEDARSTPIQRVPTPADKQRVSNVAKLLFDHGSIDRKIAVDEIVFDLDAASSKVSASR